MYVSKVGKKRKEGGKSRVDAKNYCHRLVGLKWVAGKINNGKKREDALAVYCIQQKTKHLSGINRDSNLEGKPPCNR